MGPCGSGKTLAFLASVMRLLWHHLSVCSDLTDAPSIPSKPEVVDSDNDFILVKWNRPTDDGGTAVLGYNVERKDSQSNRWVKLNTQLLTVTSS